MESVPPTMQQQDSTYRFHASDLGRGTPQEVSWVVPALRGGFQSGAASLTQVLVFSNGGDDVA